MAAQRELEEETGWIAEKLEALGSFYGSNGISDETFHLVLATGQRLANPTPVAIPKLSFAIYCSPFRFDGRSIPQQAVCDVAGPCPRQTGGPLRETTRAQASQSNDGPP